MTEPGNPFWAYSQCLWRDTEVVSACLRLQDRAAVDVNLVLFCVWTAAVGYGRLTGQDVQSVVAATRPWQEGVLRPLRAVRRELAAGFGAMPGPATFGLLQALRRAELDAERIEQQQLHSALDLVGRLGTTTEMAVTATASISTYFAHLGKPFGTDDRYDVACILSAVFGPKLGEEVGA